MRRGKRDVVYASVSVVTLLILPGIGGYEKALKRKVSKGGLYLNLNCDIISLSAEQKINIGSAFQSML